MKNMSAVLLIAIISTIVSYSIALPIIIIHDTLYTGADYVMFALLSMAIGCVSALISLGFGCEEVHPFKNLIK
jgi:hypothetical protein